MFSFKNRIFYIIEKRWCLIHKIPNSILWTLFLGIVFTYCYFFYSNFVKPYSFRWKAIYGDINFPKGEIRGIDISHYQKKVDWQRLKKAKINNQSLFFVFIKATEGCEDCDSLFYFNFKSAKKHNIKRGAYHFFSYHSSGISQAKYFCSTAKLQKGDLPPVLDIEFDKEIQFTNDAYRQKTEIQNWLLYTENYYRIKPIIYASYNFKSQFLQDPFFEQYPYWIAHYYLDSLTYVGNWNFWQHTDAGHVDGIDGFVDLNLFNGNEDELNNMCLR